MGKINTQPNGDHYNTVTQKLNYSAWVSNGFLRVRRDALELSSPEQEYNYVTTLLEGTGLSPMNFGIGNPKAERYKDLSREALIDMVISLEESLTSAYIHM